MNVSSMYFVTNHSNGRYGSALAGVSEVTVMLPLRVKHFAFANTAVDSVPNATLNLARGSKIILSRRT